jgi:hypothetical protein
MMVAVLADAGYWKNDAIEALCGANRFGRRGRSAVRSEWRLLTATHNLVKLHQHQLVAS